jgi:hypothetical protein
MKTTTFVRCNLNTSNPETLRHIFYDSSAKPLESTFLDESIAYISFSSATEAVLHAVSLIIAGNPGIKQLALHTLDGEVDSPALEQQFSSLLEGADIQSPLVVSRSTFLLTNTSEVLGALLPSRGSNHLYKWSPMHPEVSSTHESLSLHKLRFYSNALDYVLLLLLYISVHVAWRGPQTLLTMWLRNRVEAEALHIDNGHKDFFWRASSGEAVHLGPSGSISHKFAFPTGTYSIQFAYKSRYASSALTLYINNSPSHLSIPVREQFSVMNIGEFHIDRDDSLRFDTPNVVDYIEYSPPGVALAAPGAVQNVDRFKDILNLIGLWGHRSYSEAALTLFFMIPLAQCLLGWVFLTIFRFTPGAWLLGLEITTVEGKVPGVFRALLRYLGFLASIPALGVGWLWPAFTGGDKTWSDIVSGTQVYRRGYDEA